MSLTQMLLGGYGGAAGGDPYFANVISLVHFDGSSGSTTFTDQKSKTWSVLATGPELTTSVVKFGSAALNNQSEKGISTPDASDWDFGSGDFTIEMWFRNSGSGTAAFPILICKKDAVNFSPFQIQLNDSTRAVICRCSTDGTTYGSSITSSSSLYINDTWYAVAMVRDGSTLRAFVDGTSIGTASISGSLTTNTDQVSIGNTSAQTIGIGGYIDELRVTKGVARYTSNYTPATEAFPNF